MCGMLEEIGYMTGEFKTNFIPQREEENITIRQLLERAEHYAQGCNRIYDGENIQMNAYGEMIEQPVFEVGDFQEVYQNSDKTKMEQAIQDLKNMPKIEREKEEDGEEYHGEFL